MKGRFNTWGNGYMAKKNEFYCQECGQKIRGKFYKKTKVIKTKYYPFKVVIKTCMKCASKK